MTGVFANDVQRRDSLCHARGRDRPSPLSKPYKCSCSHLRAAAESQVDKFIAKFAEVVKSSPDRDRSSKLTKNVNVQQNKNQLPGPGKKIPNGEAHARNTVEGGKHACQEPPASTGTNTSEEMSATRTRRGFEACSECGEEKTKLWVCLACDFTGCADSHAIAHYIETDHYLGMSIEREELYCMLCEDFVYHWHFDLERAVAQEERLGNITHLSRSGSRKRRRDGDLRAWLEGNEVHYKDVYQHPGGPLNSVGSVVASTSLESSVAYGLRGLLNMGHTCFMNCILQCLIHNPLVRNYFLADAHNKRKCLLRRRTQGRVPALRPAPTTALQKGKQNASQTAELKKGIQNSSETQSTTGLAAPGRTGVSVQLGYRQAGASNNGVSQGRATLTMATGGGGGGGERNEGVGSSSHTLGHSAGGSGAAPGKLDISEGSGGGRGPAAALGTATAATDGLDICLACDMDEFIGEMFGAEEEGVDKTMPLQPALPSSPPSIAASVLPAFSWPSSASAMERETEPQGQRDTDAKREMERNNNQRESATGAMNAAEAEGEVDAAQRKCQNVDTRASSFNSLSNTLHSAWEIAQSARGDSSSAAVADARKKLESVHSALAVPNVPHRLFYSLWRHADYLAGYDQQDAHEFLVGLLDGIHSHSHMNAMNGGQSPRVGSNGVSLCSCIVHETFAGSLRSLVTCTECGGVSVAYDPYLDLSLPLSGDADGQEWEEGAAAANGDSEVDLLSLLTRFTRIEKLGSDAKVRCEKCQSYQEGTKQLLIQALPNVLCLHIKRFDALRREKLGQRVRFPLHLDMKPFVHTDKIQMKVGKSEEDELAKNDGKEGKATKAEQSLEGPQHHHSRIGSNITPSAAGGEQADMMEIDSVPTLSSMKADTVAHGHEDCENDGGGISHKSREGFGLTAEKASSSKPSPKEDSDSKSSILYDLFAVVEHHGTMSSGHYTNYVLVNDAWFKCDDPWITEANVSDVLGSQAYLLFYVRRGLCYEPEEPAVQASREEDLTPS